MYSDKEIFKQAESDPTCLIIKDEITYAIINNGTRIERFDDGTYEYMNTSTSGDYYEPLSSECKMTIESYGWALGTLKVKLINNIYKLNRIEVAIKDEVNSRQNPKILTFLKRRREEVMEVYNTSVKKTKKLKSY
jgi:hypothetical protein